jgi:uncharacterized protein DUF2272
MPDTTSLRALSEAQSATDTTIQEFLRSQEDDRGREIIGWALETVEGAPDKGINYARYSMINPNLPDSTIEVFSFPDDANADNAARQKLTSRTAIDGGYGPAIIGGQRRIILLTRPGQELTFRGLMSTFGGPSDTGMSATEGLALVRRQDLSIPNIRDCFPPGTTEPLGHNLDPAKNYLACRWNYLVTPASFLRTTPVTVRNVLTGKTAAAQPVDWGPAAWTGRVADLSPGLATALGLHTNDECEVIVPLPAGAMEAMKTASVTGGDYTKRLVSLTTNQYDEFHRYTEDDAPLAAQIHRYWQETGLGDQPVSTAWSAAFVSWCVQKAGASAAEFRVAASHAVFVKWAINNAATGVGVFKGRKITGYQPKAGDIIQSNRNGGNITNDTAAVRDDYESHSAIVVQISQDANGPCALTIGGNESNSIRIARVGLKDGLVEQRDRNPYICVIETEKAT